MFQIKLFTFEDISIEMNTVYSIESSESLTSHNQSSGFPIKNNTLVSPFSSLRFRFIGLEDYRNSMKILEKFLQILTDVPH